MKKFKSGLEIVNYRGAAMTESWRKLCADDIEVYVADQTAIVGEAIKNECFYLAVEHGAEMRVLGAIRSLDVTTVLAKEAGSEK